MIGSLISGVTALLFPLFASYRALASNDVTLLRPWLMYWVVFGSFQFSEYLFYPVLRFIPLYGLFRLGFLVWLVAPQTQGAVQLYQSHFEPWLSRRDESVETVIATVIEFLHSSGWARLLSLVGINVPKPPPPGANAGPSASGGPTASGVAAWASSWTSGSTNQPQSPSSTRLTDMLMSRFRLPGTPDSNLSAYLPSLIGVGDKSEYSAIVRNRLLSMVRSIDTRQNPGDAAAREADAGVSSDAQADVSSLARDSDEYDFVERPQRTHPPHETEIEREVEASLRHESQSQGEARRRWL